MRGFGVYGWSLFVGLPILVSTLSSFFGRSSPRARSVLRMALPSFRSSYFGIMLRFIAIDGFICLAMALPFATALCVPGAGFGRYFARLASSSLGGSTLPCLFIAPPAIRWLRGLRQKTRSPGGAH